MHFSANKIPRLTAYKLLTSTIIPRPIAFVTTLASDGTPNAAPFSYFNAMGSAPPVVALGFEPPGQAGVKDTAANIRAMGSFVVNIVDEPLADQMNACAASLPPETDELALAGIETLPSLSVAPPRIAASPVHMECRFFHEVALSGGGYIIIGEVLEFHLRDGLVISEDPLRIDTNALAPIGRLMGSDYARTLDRFSLTRPK